MKVIFDCILWLFSHSPIFCASDDNNFGTLEWNNIYNKKVRWRFSLFNIIIGDQILYFFTIDFSAKKPNLYYNLKLTEMDGKILTDENIEEIQERYRKHIKNLNTKELEIEKEALCYHIQNENSRLETSINKINIYATIVLAILPLLLAILDFKIFFEISLPLQIGVGLLIYGLLNICVFIFRSIKVQRINKSRFQELRNDPKKAKKIVLQYQYDWQQIKYKAELFVSYVLNLQKWVIHTMILALVVTIGIAYEQSGNKGAFKKLEGNKVITISVSEIDVSYSESAVEWAKLIYEIEQKAVKEIVFITDGQVPENYIQILEKYHELDIKIVLDDLMPKNQLKIVKGN